MRNNLPRFTTAIVGWLVVVVAVAVGWKLLQDRQAGKGGNSENPLLQLARPFLGGPPADSTFPQPAADEPIVPALSPDPSRSAVDGRELLDQAAHNLTQYRSLAARVRQRIDLFDQPLSGAGIYQQWGRGQEHRRVRLELKLHVAGQTASLQQICDGRFLWDRRDILGTVTLSRIDLLKVRQSITSDPLATSPDALRHWLALGGLAQLLAGINEHFEFRTAEAAKLGKLPVWVLEGRWRAASIERFFPVPADSPLAQQPLETRLPEYWPERVLVVLGADENIPLFPYRVEYRRRAARDMVAGQGGDQFVPQATLELFEVQLSADLDPDEFRYNPGNQEVIDETQAFVRKLRGDGPTTPPHGPVN